MDERADNETTSSKRSKTAQDGFRSRLEKRDKMCKITGSDTYDACHIVPYDFYSKYAAAWDNLFENSCLIAAHKVDDIRNGLLLTKKWHTHFDEKERIQAETKMKAKAEDVNLPSHDSNDTIALKFGPEDHHILDWADKVDRTGFSTYLDVQASHLTSKNHRI